MGNNTDCKMELLCKPKRLSPNRNLNENWHKFRQHFDIFLKVAYNIMKLDECKVAILLNIIGKDGIELLYKKFNLQETERNDLARVLQCFEEYFNPEEENVVNESFKFYSRIQEKDEKFENFLTEIKKLSRLCEFGTMTNRMIRDKIVCGIRDKALQERLLKMKNLNLQDAIDYCKAAEIQERNLQGDKTEACNVRKKIIQKSNKILGSLTQKSNCIIYNTKYSPKYLPYEKNRKECSKLNHLPVTEEKAGDNEQIPVRQWIRKHFTKLAANRAKCNHCFVELQYKHPTELPTHLRIVHSDKLTDKEMGERKLSWVWDYFTPENSMPHQKATCNICNKTYNIGSTSRCLNIHLKRDHNMEISKDTNKDMTTKKVEFQEDLAASSNNLYGNKEGTGCSFSEKITARQTNNVSDDTNRNIITVKGESLEENSTALSNNLYENTEETVFKKSAPSSSSTQKDKMDYST